MDCHQPLQLQQQRSISSQSGSAESALSETSSLPIPAIKLHRKCTSGWTCSSQIAVSGKLRRGGGGARVKLKLRPWMAEPLVVKEGDASLRLATDLPRFNWLEMKLNQKQPETSAVAAAAAATNTMTRSQSHQLSNVVKPVAAVAATPPSSSAHPLKIRILETSEAAATAAAAAAMTAAAKSSVTSAKRALPALIPTSLSMIPVTPPSSAQQQQTTPPATSEGSDGSENGSCTSRWPLKKRLIRCQSESTSPPVSPVDSTEKLIRTKSSEDDSNAQLRGPVIMKNVLPPTPPASSAPPEVQDRPLDLSCSNSNTIVDQQCQPTLFAKPVVPGVEEKAEVEIIAMKVNSNTKIAAPERVGFHPPQQTTAVHRHHNNRTGQQHHPHPYHHYQHIQQQQQQHQQLLFQQQQHQQQQQQQQQRAHLNLQRSERSNKQPQQQTPASVFRAYQRDHPNHHVVLQQHQQQQHIPVPIRVPEPTYPEWSRPIDPANYRHFPQPDRPLPSTGAPTLIPTNNRSFVPPPLRPLPQHWNAIVAQRNNNNNIGPTTLPQVPSLQQHQHQQQQQQMTPRVFHPHQIIANRATTIDKKLSGVSSAVGAGRSPSQPQQQPQRPAPPAVTTPSTYSPDWGVRRCVVCSRQADFRCAGCHGNAYCSTACQAKDWPQHSQLCQRGS